MIYFDHNATTPVDPEVLAAMLPYFSEKFANPASSNHLAGREIMSDVESARKNIADVLGCESNELIFTSGSTESINLAIQGVSRVYRSKGKHIITYRTEHKAVLETCDYLQKSGFEVTILPVDREGRPDLNELESQIRPDTILVAAMLVNNETGTIFPVKEIAELVHRAGSIFFCDATQAAGKMQLNIPDTGADLLCLSGHKIYGPKGSGLLYIKRKNPRVTLAPLLFGGGHENNLRPGTLNVPAIIGLAKAIQLIGSRSWSDNANISKLRTYLEQGIMDNGDVYVNGDMRNRAPNTSNLLIKGIKASELITLNPEIALAMGSACTSAIPKPSHVLKAMGLSDEDVQSSIRISLGRTNTMEEITEAVSLISAAIQKLRNNRP